MPLSLVQITFISPLQQPFSYNLNPKSLFPSFESEPLKRFIFSKKKTSLCTRTKTTITHASLIEAPVLWAGRICIFYALLKAGLAGSKDNPLVSDLGIVDANENESDADLGFSKWTQSILGKPVIFNLKRNDNVTCLDLNVMDSNLANNVFVYEAKEEDSGRKLVSKWHPTTKGTLRRNYRVPSKSEGRRLLKAIASLLSDDDHFVDATSHKGCQIRRESAHGESVCCNNVRALFDELPTPHITVEITPFPFGPLSEKDYTKAEKLEKVLRSSPSV
ncbi:hypothetical protein TanjilG_11934 [Lupinus angustifolius]|uniref:Uncharacterized protein n=1 Tax=Lupinus angustifolius TaxID=3871 RepID=A0A1J7H3X7_LUPAN|nr:hypothetical protein TanjilG_11934 [Lupinus angustifolius]